MNVYEKIAAQQQKGSRMVKQVGRHLADIIQGKPEWEEIVSQDLDKESMDIAKCEREIFKFFREHDGIEDWEAENVIRKFYGLPERDEPVAPVRQSPAPQVHTAPPQMPQPPEQSDDLIDLDAFL